MIVRILREGERPGLKRAAEKVKGFEKNCEIHPSAAKAASIESTYLLLGRVFRSQEREAHFST
jgi:hypothetical protein